MWQAGRGGWRLLVLAILLTTAGCSARAGSSAAPGAPGAPGQAAGHGRVWLESIQMISAKTGWGLLATSNPMDGRGAAVLPARTADGGRSWITVAPAAVVGLVGEPIMLQAATPSRAWLAVYLRVGPGRQATEVFGTENGGASWSRSAPVGHGEPLSVSFADPAHGWLLENLGAAMNQNWVAVYRTTDGGLHWSLTARTQPSPQSGISTGGLPAACDKTGLTVSSPRTGWITGDCTLGSEVLVTHDAGYHWVPQPLPVRPAACSPDGCYITPPQFTGRTGVLAVGHYPATGELLVSNDAGHSWQLRHLPAGAGPYPQARFFSADRGIAVSGGTQGRIGSICYLTADAGRSWTPVPQGRRFGQAGAAQAAEDFVSTTDGFAWIPSYAMTTGTPPDIYLTTNSGRTWRAITPQLA